MAECLNADDLRGLTPLVYSYIDPYGSFRLDLSVGSASTRPRFGPKSVGTQMLLSYDQQNGMIRLPPVTAMLGLTPI